MSILLSLNLCSESCRWRVEIRTIHWATFLLIASLFPRGGREGLASWRAYEIYPAQHCIYRLNKVTFEVDWEGMRIGISIVGLNE